MSRNIRNYDTNSNRDDFRFQELRLRARNERAKPRIDNKSYGQNASSPLKMAITASRSNRKRYGLAKITLPAEPWKDDEK